MVILITFKPKELNAFNLDLTIILIDLGIDAELTKF